MGPQPGQPSAFAIRAFGASATVNGQIFDTEADVALARAEGVVIAPDSEASTKLTFERTFELEGSPNGWGQYR